MSDDKLRDLERGLSHRRWDVVEFEHIECLAEILRDQADQIEVLQTEVGLMKDRVAMIGTLEENVAKLEKRIEDLEAEAGFHNVDSGPCTNLHDGTSCYCSKSISTEPQKP